MFFVRGLDRLLANLPAGLIVVLKPTISSLQARKAIDSTAGEIDEPRADLDLPSA
jgi:hypothetical protein